MNWTEVLRKKYENKCTSLVSISRITYDDYIFEVYKRARDSFDLKISRSSNSFKTCLVSVHLSEIISAINEYAEYKTIRGTIDIFNTQTVRNRLQNSADEWGDAMRYVNVEVSVPAPRLERVINIDMPNFGQFLEDNMPLMNLSPPSNVQSAARRFSSQREVCTCGDDACPLIDNPDD